MYRKPGRGYNLERMVNFVQNNAGNAIDAALTIFGLPKFCDMIADRRTTQNSKYLELINQYGRYTDRVNTEIAEDYLNKLAPETDEEREDHHPMLKVFTRREWVVWSGVRHLMCKECGAVLPENAFSGVTYNSNFAVCYKCEKSPST